MNHSARYCINWSLLCFSLCFGLVLISPKTALAKSCFEGGGGHDVPTPFEVVNSKFELADGEIYQLTGNIVFEKDVLGDTIYRKPYLAVDLSYTPWLRNKGRARFPYYPLDESYAWRELEGKKVILLVRAHGKIVADTTGRPYYELTLGLLHQMR